MSDFDDQFNAMARPALLAAMGDLVTYRTFDNIATSVRCLLGPISSALEDDHGESINYARHVIFSVEDVPVRRFGDRVIVNPGMADAVTWVVGQTEVSEDEGMVTVGLTRSIKTAMTMPGLRRS